MIVEQILIIASSTTFVREVKNLSPNFNVIDNSHSDR